MRIAFFDCFSGASGNMVLGALVDAGLDVERLKAELSKLQVSGYEIAVRTVRRRGLQGTHIAVKVTEEQPVRHLHHLEEIIKPSNLPDPVKTRSLAVFRRLAEAEAGVHSTSVEKVHFHEVGAVDAIVDVVGSAIGLWLLGVQRVYASPVHVGRGTVECAHGTLPVPAPATLELLRGVPTYGRDVEAELVTPTGAAILTTVVEEFGGAPPMRVEQIGYGAGSRDLPIPNLLRVAIGDTVKESEDYEEDVVTLLETNIDDMNPQWYEYVMELLFDAGAVDVYLTPIQMKRNRPAVQLSVIVPAGQMTDVLQILFTETTTIGVRMSQVRRWKLAREQRVVETDYGPISVKVAWKGDKIKNISPEYRECQMVAQERGVPLKVICQMVVEAARAQIGTEAVDASQG